MKSIGPSWLQRSLLVAVSLLAVTCDPEGEPRAGSQTNWLRACDRDAQCGSEMMCDCGVCTRPCDAQTACDGLSGASCVPASDTGAIGLCGGQAPASAGLCLPRCADQVCSPGQTCISGVCSVLPEATAHVLVNESTRYQSLTGLGATLAYGEAEVLRHPRQAELVAAMFSGLGLDVLRLRNRYAVAGDDDLTTTAELIQLASQQLGRKPTVILSSWSPPTALKASGELICRGNADTCTLAKLPSGGFDYAGYATYWRGSLDAYATLGVSPDYFGLQNNPDFVPTAEEPGEGCRFLPVEGRSTVTANGTTLEVDYPGLAQATTAVLDALTTLPSRPRLIAPEGSFVGAVASYLAAMDVSRVDAISHHLYGTNPDATDWSAFTSLNTLARGYGKPIFQTEMSSDGLGTATLLHHSLVTEGVSAYLQAVLVTPETMLVTQPGALISLGSTDFALLDQYHALRHFAFYTDPGWTRIEAASDAPGLLVSAWQSPQANAMTVVLVNRGANQAATQLELGDWASASSEVIRTVFNGTERSANLGALPAESIINVPAGSVVTISLRR